MRRISDLFWRTRLRRIIFIFVFLISVISGMNAYAFNLPDTGQTKCYQAANPYAEIPCTGTGQDGEYNINPMSFTDNKDGTVTDNNTGLIWQKQDDGKAYNWYQASGTYDATYNPISKSVCGSLKLGGFKDWRLPSENELITIVDYSVPYPGPTINATYFPNAQQSSYWASTSAAFYTGYGWNVRFLDGTGNYWNGDKTSDQHYVRCARGGQTQQAFTDNNDGTVTDHKTGLIWQQGEPGKMDWGSALSYCEGLSLAGHSDWRLPDVKELESLTDYSKSDPDPAIDTNFFPNVNLSWYWSSTTGASEPTSGAWNVYFSDGGFGGYGKDNNGYVRCVRAGQSRCAAALASDLSLHLPILSYSGSAFWADFSYVPNTASFNLTNAGLVTDTAPFAGCSPATLSSDFKMHVPAVTFNSVFYWLDMIYSQGAFSITGAGQN